VFFFFFLTLFARFFFRLKLANLYKNKLTIIMIILLTKQCRSLTIVEPDLELAAACKSVTSVAARA